MKIETKEIRDGDRVGDIVWICHYNRPDLDKKPLRNLPPTQALIKSNEDLPKNKRVYYSQNHFVVIGKKGKQTSKIISPVDNTGFRSRCGNELYVFTTESECIHEWNKQLDEHCDRLNERELNAAKYWRQEKESLLSEKI